MDVARKVCMTVFALWVVSYLTAGDVAAQKKAAPVTVEAVPAGAAPTPPPGGNPGQPGAPAGPGAPGQAGKPGGKPGEGAPAGEGAKPEAPAGVTRPNQPAKPADPAELKLRPNAEGKIRFNFQGQPWLGVLEWLAEISHLSLDWQELPPDFLNLRTQREYTVAEARDVINRHLLDRGFTMLRHGEVLTVVNIKKLDPALVPRVNPEELETRDPHEYVKVSFPLKWLIAEKAVDEYKPMLSPNHKISALKSTNRIEVMDAVTNLREVYAVLRQEQSPQGQERLVREFKLQYTRAADIQKLLEALLGMESKGSSKPMTPQQMQQMQQQMQMEQQMAQQGGQKPAGPKQEAKIYLVVNMRENSILANAPPDQMAVIEQAVKTLDIPSGNGQSILKNLNRVHVYRLAAIDPEALVKMLDEMGDLDPTTRLQPDKANRSVIAHASLADHVTIRTLVQKLDGSDRRFEVIKLRRLGADYVAGTIEFMMGAGEKKQSNQRFNPYYIDYGYMMGGRSPAAEDESKKFRVDADVENNRLLLWANSVEMEEVQNLLVKLGEVNGGANPETIRVLDSLDPEEADQLLERLFRTWPSVAPNPLKVAPRQPANGPQTGESKQAVPAAPTKSSTLRDTTTKNSSRSIRIDGTVLSSRSLLALADATEGEVARPLVEQKTEPAVAEQQPAEENEAKQGEAEIPGTAAQATPRVPGRDSRTPASAPPVMIGRTPDGRIIISSDDAEALDRLEELADQLAPPRRDYKVFHLKYKSTWAYGVALNLKDFFEDKGKKSGSSWNPYFGGYMPSNNSNDESARRLSKKKPLKFIADSDSHTIIVVGADQGQLKTIQELIDMYDVPDTAEGKQIRQTKVVKIRFSKARIIADAVKEVYRDLLSANDPALQQNQQGKDKDKPAERSYTYIYGSNTGEDDKKPETPMKFKGLLSIGVDDLSNTLVISAAENLMGTVSETVNALDIAARPTVNTLQVMKVSKDIDVSTLQQRLQKVSKQPTPPPQQGKHPGQQQQPRGPQQQQQPQDGSESVTVIENF